jgi:NAD(P)-dependent dehydrogenase (short-subunit alcohol dehydrogenase family)
MTITLITGTSKGIGKKLLKFYLKKGHNVISISRSPIDINHNNLLHVQQDINCVSTKKRVESLIMDKQINNCILNAGAFKNALFHKMEYKDWVDIFNINLISTYNILNPVLNNMRNNNEGNIIFMSSVVGLTGTKGASNYSSSKSALYGLTKSLALENANKNILINSISPGYINEGMGNVFDKKMKSKINNTIPLGKFGETQDIINITDYLIEKNNYMTGNNININGGLI